MADPVQLPAGYQDAKPFQASSVQLPAGYEDASPSFLRRFAQTLGIPTTKEELENAVTPTKVGDLPMIPKFSGLGMAQSYASNLYNKAKDLLDHPELGAALRAVMALTPGGGSQQSAAEDIAQKNYAGASGTAAGTALQFALPEIARRAGAVRTPAPPQAPIPTATETVPTAAPVAAQPSAASVPFGGKLSDLSGPQILGRLRNIAADIQAKEAAEAAKTPRASRAKVTEPVEPKNDADLMRLLRMSVDQAAPQQSDLASNVLKVLNRESGQRGLTVGLEKLRQAPELKGVSPEELKAVAKQLRDSGKVWGDYVGDTDNIVGIASRH